MEETPTYANEKLKKKKDAVSTPWQLLQYCQLPKKFPSCFESYTEFFAVLIFLFIYVFTYCTVSFRTLIALGVHSGHTRQNIDCSISPKVPDHHTSRI